MKKGQVTIFIIAGIMIVFIVGILIAKLSAYSDKEYRGDFNTKHINNYIESTLEMVAKDSVISVSKQGGRFAPGDYRELDIDGESVRVGYGLKSGKRRITETLVEKELCRSITSNMPQRLDLSFIEKQGMEYERGELDCNSQIGKKLLLELDAPLNISKGKANKSINYFNAEIKVDLEDILKTAEKIVKEINDTASFNMSEYDFSCKRIRGCSNDGIVKLMLYEPWEDNPGLKFYFAVDQPMIDNKCSSLEDINNGLC